MPAQPLPIPSVELDENSHAFISRIVHEKAGIVLGKGKQELVKARLAKRIRVLGLNNVKDYVAYLKEDRTGQELRELIDVITTNKTSFFREPDHFDFVAETIVPALRTRSTKMRFWSAGCSTGEEPYSLAITLRENLSNVDLLDVKILATDISNRVLAYARKAEYTQDKMEGVPESIAKRYFVEVRRENGTVWSVSKDVRELVRFARLNLLDEWPMKGPFDVIFCRNVMIYFDKATRQTLVSRFCDYLSTGGYLIVGHSEGLSVSTRILDYVRPGIYRKP
ncbi:MAG: protein-glutamate O-methyltransferase [Armatimonadota bacterium]|nr:protein-glutamate O-methyltransferase [Armatimonadota bacterium]